MPGQHLPARGCFSLSHCLCLNFVICMVGNNESFYLLGLGLGKSTPRRNKPGRGSICLVPIPLWSHFFLFFPNSFYSSHIGLLAIHQINQAFFHLKGFALAISSAWNAFPLNIHMVPSGRAIPKQQQRCKSD